jgi:hypothetical protein
VEPQASAAGIARSKVISPVPPTAASLVTGLDEDSGKSVQSSSTGCGPSGPQQPPQDQGPRSRSLSQSSADRDLASTPTFIAISPDSDSAQKNASAHAPDLLKRTSCAGPDPAEFEERLSLSPHDASDSARRRTDAFAAR